MKHFKPFFQTEANSKQVSLLADKVTVRGSRRRGGAAKPSASTQVKQVDAKPTTKEGEGGKVFNCNYVYFNVLYQVF